ncbi:MAG: Na(+)-translocating NADH-quinone reductase subunit A [Geminicoccaceae bacterium]
MWSGEVMPSQYVKKTKGLNIPIDGAPARVVENAQNVDAVAVLGADYVGLEPKMLVNEGDQVALGQPLFQQKRDAAIVFTAPASGKVSGIHRGERRALKSVIIDVDEMAEPEAKPGVTDAGDITAAALRARLLETGLWTAFRTRPFSRIPASNAEPYSIFVAACETRPLAGVPESVVAEHADAFALGIDLVARLSAGSVYLCTGPQWSGPTGSAPTIGHVVFDGPHPAGLPGTQIHHLDPVGPGRTVWHIGYQDVIAIGKLIGDGRLWTERVVALGGDGFSNPRMVRTRLGADLIALTAGEFAEPAPGTTAARLISGCVLSGRYARGAESYLGRYHLQVSAIAQKSAHRKRPWQRLSENRYSFFNVLARLRGKRSTYPITTDQNGRFTAMLATDAFENLIPMDVMAVPLLRALLIKDTDKAQVLGCLELDEEDLALCSFICPGKNDYATVLRRNLELIEREG